MSGSIRSGTRRRSCARFVESRYPRLLGLTGSKDRIDAARAAFRLFALRTDDPQSGGGYALAHTAVTHALDADRAYAVQLPDGNDADQIATRLRTLLA